MTHIFGDNPFRDAKQGKFKDLKDIKEAPKVKEAKGEMKGDNHGHMKKGSKPPKKTDEVKSAPKGFHFTKTGQLKKGDADVDGPGGEKLRSDPKDDERKTIVNLKNYPKKK